MEKINFLTLTNSGYEFFCDSQIENFRKDFLKNHNLLIYCADTPSFERLKSKDLPENISIRKIEDTEIGGLHGYLVGRFKELMRLKFPLICDYIKETQGPIWFIDNDVLFFQDPAPFIDTTKDILFQPDAGDYEDRYSWVCTGCFWVNNTDRSLSFLKNLIEMQNTVDRGEQEILNDYCKSWTSRSNMEEIYKGSISDFNEADLDIFPYHLFQNGYAAFKHNLYDKNECVMIHFNHEQNFETKKNNFNKVKNFYNL
jgi:hypothetical protein